MLNWKYIHVAVGLCTVSKKGASFKGKIADMLLIILEYFRHSPKYLTSIMGCVN